MSRHRAPDEAEAAAPDTPAEPEAAEEPTEPVARPRPRPGTAAAPAPRRFWLRAPVLLTAGVLLTVLAIVAAVIAIRREDTADATRTPAIKGAGLTSPALALNFVAGATADITAVTAYDYRSLDIALTSGLAVTTGAYRQSYRAAITGELGQRARADRTVQSFQQTAAGIGTMAANGTTAKVLIFGLQSVTRGDAAPVVTPVTLAATMVRQGDRYLIGRLEADTNAGLPPGSAQLAQAAETARRHVLASLTLRRATLTADYDAALADTVDPRRSALTATLAPLRLAVGRGQYQLTGRVTAIAVERVVSNAVAVLIAATGLRTTGGTTSVVDDARLRVTVTRTAAGWRVADSQPVSG